MIQVFASVSTAAAGDNALTVVPPGDNQILLVEYMLVAILPVTIQWRSGVGGGATVLSGAMTMATGIPIAMPYSPLGHVICAAGSELNLFLGGAVQVSGHIVWGFAT